MYGEISSELIFSSTPLSDDENTVTLDVISNESESRGGLPQKQQLEGKITLNTARCLIFSLPSADPILEKTPLAVDCMLYDLYLVVVPFTLHPAPGNKFYTEMTLWIELVDPEHTALDLCPKNVVTNVQATKSYSLSPQIRFQEAQIGLGGVRGQFHFDVLRPTITASGEGQHIFYWTYAGFAEERAITPETRHVLFIAQVPRGTVSLQGQIFYELVKAKKFLREWVSKQCSVAPYSFSWDLTRSQPFYKPLIANVAVPAGTMVAALPEKLETADLADICVVGALPEEAEAFIRAVEEIYHVSFRKNYDRRKREYRSTTIQNNAGEDLKLHVSWPASYGLMEISLYLPTLLGEFKPRFVIMTGICAGDRRRVHLGDLVVADRTFLYDEGKVTLDGQGQTQFQTDTATYHISPAVLRAVRMFDAWKPLIASLGRHPLPECHIAPMASGNAVRSDDPFAQIQRAVRKTVAIDMEGAAFYRCIAEFPGLQALLVKGVCDFGDKLKNDTFHAYAASASALYALAFLQEYVTEQVLPRRWES